MLPQVREVIRQLRAVREPIAHSNSVLSSLQLFERVVWKDDIERSIATVVLRSAFDAEVALPGSFSTFIETVDSGLEHPPLSPQIGVVKVRKVRSHELSKIIDDVTQRRMSRDIVKECIHLVAGGRVVIERGTQLRPVIDIVSGHTFDVYTTVKGELTNPKFVVIDGYIESVGEIHHLLQRCSETLDPLVLVTRGYADDVVSTLAHNLNENRIAVAACVVPYDLEGANTLVDISTAMGGDVTSSVRGDLISAIDYDSLPRSARARVGGNRLIVNVNHTQQSRLRLESHMSAISDKMSTVDPSIHRLYESRLRSLCDVMARVLLPDTIDFPTLSLDIDRGLRAAGSALRSGVTESGELPTVSVVNVLTMSCIDTLRSLEWAV